MRALVFIGRGQALEGQVVGLGAAGDEDDLGRIGVDQPGYGFAGLGHGLLDDLAFGVGALVIAEELPEIGKHGRQDIRMDGRGGDMIEIDATHGQRS